MSFIYEGRDDNGLEVGIDVCMRQQWGGQDCQVVDFWKEVQGWGAGFGIEKKECHPWFGLVRTGCGGQFIVERGRGVEGQGLVDGMIG